MIDLHVHSNASDGTCSPIEVADLAIHDGITTLALTDHDTIDGIPEIMTYCRDKTLEIIPGIEMSCYYKKREIHILGLWVDYENPEFIELIKVQQESRMNRNLQMIALMQADGINITLEKLLHGNPDSVITRAHFARVLQEEGLVSNKEQAFKRYLGTGCKYYLPREKLTCEAAMQILTKYANVISLAHPLIYKLGYTEVENMIIYLKELGLNAIECFHSSNNSYESQRLSGIALRHNLLRTAGSDFHGDNKPDIKLGVGRGFMHIPETILPTLKENIFPE